jgi:mannose-6-phosphate isomerase
MTVLYPLRFRPILRRAVWGGRCLETSLGKRLPPGNDWAESWEICDLGADQSIVESGPLAGMSLRQLVLDYGPELLGIHHGPRSRFPLLVKFLDATQRLSVQVHPDDAHAATSTPPGVGKSEAWVVIESLPDSKIYSGLRCGVDRAALAAAIGEGRCEECLHVLQPSPGDCIFLPAGTVHALGEGLLVVEIQQPSDLTYRLFDWNRPGCDGKPRTLHVEQALDVIDFGRGPVFPRQPCPTDRREVVGLVECDHFVIHRWDFDTPLSAGGDRRCHIIIVLEGTVQIDVDCVTEPLFKGGLIALPATLGETRVTPLGRAILLDCYPP